jgi:hypothetical protein
MGCRSLSVRMIIRAQLSLERFASARFFSIPEHILPEIKPSSTIFGRISKGVLAGIPVGAVRSVLRRLPMLIPIHTQVLGDQQAALVGQRCWSKGTAKSTCVSIELRLTFLNHSFFNLLDMVDLFLHGLFAIYIRSFVRHWLFHSLQYRRRSRLFS